MQEFREALQKKEHVIEEASKKTPPAGIFGDRQYIQLIASFIPRIYFALHA